MSKYTNSDYNSYLAAIELCSSMANKSEWEIEVALSLVAKINFFSHGENGEGKQSPREKEIFPLAGL